MDQIYDNLSHVKVSDKGLTWNTDLMETLELENLLCKINSADVTLLDRNYSSSAS